MRYAELAKIYDGEIVSADSMQIYKGLSIATAKPTKEEMQGVPHYLIDFLEPEQAFSVADYVKLAGERIREIHSRGKVPILSSKIFQNLSRSLPALSPISMRFTVTTP